MIHRHAVFSCDLDLDPMTLIYELDVNILKMYLHTNNELLDEGFQQSEHHRQTDRQTDTHTHTHTHRQRERERYE